MDGIRCDIDAVFLAAAAEPDRRAAGSTIVAIRQVAGTAAG